MAEYLASQFPGRFSIMHGNSKLPMPYFTAKKENMFSCDILVIDGDHTYQGALADFINMHYMTKPNGKNLLVL